MEHAGTAETERTRKGVRGEAVVERVLEAAIEEVALTGYEGLTLERVAARAGVNRTTIYRRWPTKQDLMRAALERTTGEIRFDWDTGSFRGDLGELVSRAQQTLFAPGMLGMVRMMLGGDPELRALAECSRDAKVSAAGALFARSIARGEVRPDLDFVLFLDLLMGTLLTRTLFRGESLGEAERERLLDYLMAIARPAE